MDPDSELYIPLAALNAYQFCPHRCYREYVLGEWADNLFTMEGKHLHHRADSGTRRRESVQRGSVVQTTKVQVKSERFRLTGVIDIVEEGSNGIYPVEYKRGKAAVGRVWESDAVQLCAQAICLEEQLDCKIPVGYIWYFQDRKRQVVRLSDEIRTLTEEVIKAVAELITSGEPVPNPYIITKCEYCSIYDLCLPREMEKLREVYNDGYYLRR